ncbi:hypothetical protein [Corynebacterium halotolerans]
MALAQILLAEPLDQLLVLDGPTNNLELTAEGVTHREEPES